MLVITQFSASIVLIISTFIIGKQLKYIRDKDLGFNKENVISLSMHGIMPHYDAVKNELLKQPGIIAVTRSSGNIIDYNNWTGDNDWDGKPANSNLLFHPMEIDKDFISFFKIRMLQGNAFTGAIADSNHLIVNETAVEAMNMHEPIGKRLRIQTVKGTIIGVVKDFHFSSMRKKIEPAVFMYNTSNGWDMYIKTTGGDAQKAIVATQAIWKQYNSNTPFNYTFLDESFSKLYKTEQQTGVLFNLFASIAIIISCLGLFGLATYSAQVKTREIGIRKVLGASVAGIVKLLALEFMFLILAAIVIAVPVAWYAMSKWLQDFAYRISIEWWLFLIAGLMAMLIAFVTISFQSVKAAIANPVKSLRSE